MRGRSGSTTAVHSRLESEQENAHARLARGSCREAQSNRERRSGALPTLDAEPAAHLRDQSVRDRETEADAWQRRGALAAIVRLEDCVAFSGPGIVPAERDAI